jgi:hypothetical protein
MIGIAVRHAQAAGLHLRNEDSSTPANKKSTLARVWWALYSIESVLTAITGRPRIVAEKDCTVPLPGAIGNNIQTRSREVTVSSSTASRIYTSDSGTPGKAGVDPFEAAYTRLDILMDRILSGLYSARKSANSWKQVQNEIASLLKELEAWALQSLTQEPSDGANTSEPRMSRAQRLLRFYYYNAKICITRPCLCRLDQRIQDQSDVSARFNQKMAETCINAALDICSLLSGRPDSCWIYENGPWWLATHTSKSPLSLPT